MRTPTWLTIGLCLMLQGCSPPSYDIVVQNRGPEILFLAKDDRSSWGLDSVEASRVEVRDADRMLWAIEADGSGCRPEGDTPPFPLVYGQVPRCYRTIVPAQPLRAGELYQVQAHGDLRHGSGFFRLQQVANLDWEDVRDEVDSWGAIDVRRPREPADQVNRNTTAAPAAAETNAMSANRP